MIQISMNKAIAEPQPGEVLQQVPEQTITLPGTINPNIDREPYQVRA